MNEQGLIEVIWKEGRMITKKGREELNNARVSEKIGLISARMETLSYLMDFDLKTKTGNVILNVSLFPKTDFSKALKIMREVFDKKLSLGKKILVVEGGGEIDGLAVPKGKIGFGTLCTINLNGILLKAAIPVDPKFGGVLQMENSEPLRFTELISYAGSTLDPHEIFIRSQMTSVREACGGSGRILAGLREIPAVSKEEALDILNQIEGAGLGNILYIGKTGQPVLGMPVGVEKVGIVIPGGLNPVAAVAEWGIETENKALSALVDFKQLVDFKAVVS
jgi:repressor of nif and glnA expression